MSDSSVLLDTHVWLWLVDGNDRLLETKGFAAMRKAKEFGKVYLSMISIWEIGMLASKNRLRARRDYRQWMRQGLELTDVALQPLTHGVAWESSFLPGEFHADPSDRILVATARELDIPLITADANIIAYSHDGHVKAIEV